MRRYLARMGRLALLAVLALVAVGVGDRLALKLRARWARRRAARGPADPLPQRIPGAQLEAERGIDALSAFLAHAARQSGGPR